MACLGVTTGAQVAAVAAGGPGVRDGSYWLTTIRDPAAGYVSLRSTVTDVAGDATVETVYDAYGIG